MKPIAQFFRQVLCLIWLFSGHFLMTVPATQARPVDDHRTQSFKAAVVNTPQPSVVQVLVEAPTDCNVIVELKSESGDILWSQPIRNKQGSFRFKMNLTEVPDGEYTIVVRYGKKQLTYPVKLLTDAPMQAVRRSIITGPTNS